MSSITTWIVAMLGNGSSCLQYLKELFTAIKNYYHPSNNGKFQHELINFLSKLAQALVDRVHLLVVWKIFSYNSDLFVENGKLIHFGILLHQNLSD